MEIAISQYQRAGQKGDQREVLVGNAAGNLIRIEPQEFADHPVRVGGDPGGGGQLMTQFRYKMLCAQAITMETMRVGKIITTPKASSSCTRQYP